MINSPWFPYDVELLRRKYPAGSIKALCSELGRSRSSVTQMAFKLGVVRTTPGGRKGVRQPPAHAVQRVCTACGLDRSLIEFSPLRHGKFGRHSICRDCINSQSLARLQRQRDELHPAYIAQLLGLKPHLLHAALYQLKREHLLVSRELKRIKE